MTMRRFGQLVNMTMLFGALSVGGSALAADYSSLLDDDTPSPKKAAVTDDADTAKAVKKVEKKAKEETPVAAAAKKDAAEPMPAPAPEPKPIKRPWRLSDFIDTKLSFTLADDNLRENSEYSPSFRVVQNPASGYTVQASGVQPIQVNQTHLVVHHYSDGYLPGVLTEAALVLSFNLSTDPTSGSTQQSFADGGTYVRVGYIFDHETRKSIILDFTGFPFDSEAFINGFNYDLTWGGQSSFPNNRSSVPGFRVGFQMPKFYAFAGMKTHLEPLKDQLNTERVPVETVYAGLFGAGVEPLPGFKIEANTGFIQKGDNPNIPEVSGKEDRDNILQVGVSGRLSYAYGLKIGERMDLRLLQNDPRRRLEKGTKDEYEAGRFSYMVSAETTYLQQNLQNPDKPSNTKAYKAPTALLGAKFQYGFLRFHTELAYRSLEFMVFDTPGFVPYQTTPKGVSTHGEFSGILAADYTFDSLNLTLGATVGYKRPAYYGGGKSGVNIAVIKRRTGSTAYLSPFENAIEILPADSTHPSQIVETRYDVRWRLSDMMDFILEGSYIYDGNRVKLETSKTDSSVLIKKFEDDNVTNRVGLALIIQAYF